LATLDRLIAFDKPQPETLCKANESGDLQQNLPVLGRYVSPPRGALQISSQAPIPITAVHYFLHSSFAALTLA
jgi:hypothetical protein